MDYALIKSLLKAVLLPPVGLVVLALAGMLLARRRSIGTVLTAASLLLLLAISLPIVAYALNGILDAPVAFDSSRPTQAMAIVIPAGGLREHAPEYGGVTLSALTLERVRYGAMLAKRSGLPVLLTGGTAVQGTTEAEVMRTALAEEFGVSARWVESRSRNTRENATNTARMLLPSGIKRIVLVGHVFDIRRFTVEFERAGFEVVPASTGPRAGHEYSWRDWVPSMRAIEASHFACYEIAARTVDAIRDALTVVLPSRLAP